MIFPHPARQISRRALAVALCYIIYCIAFISVYTGVGTPIAIFSIIPAAVAGWAYGWRIGLLAGALMYPLDIVLFVASVGLRGAGLFTSEGVIGHLFVIALAGIIGWLNGLVRQVKAQALIITKQVQELQAEIELRQKAEQKLLEAKAEAELKNQSKSAFLASMGHEMRTPLNAILGYIELLLEITQEQSLDSIASDLNKVHTAAQHLLHLINDLLDLSKIEAGRMELHPKEMNLQSAAQSIATTTQPLVAKQNNVLELQIADNANSIWADPTRVQQILLNLISNAAKFTRNGKISLQIRLATHAEDPDCIGLAPPPSDKAPWVVIHLEDTGIGMSEAQLQRIFQPYIQIHQDKAIQEVGTGLGLVVSRHFCTMMGGELRVQSETGRGTVFTVLLPRHARAETFS